MTMRILCAGDFIEDFYIFGTATRLCPEAPVPVVVPQATRVSAGGVGLVANQLRELGADVEEWRGSFSRKERIFAGSHLVTRIDKDSLEFNSCMVFKNDICESLLVSDFPDVGRYDAIVVSDYSKGAMTDELANKLRTSRKPLFVDAKHHWGWYFGKNTTIFPNQNEADNDAYNCEAFGLVVRKRGEHGACLDIPNGLGVDATVKDIVDVTGAGDVFMAGFVCAWSHQCPAEDCLIFANALAGESCRHRGTYVVPKEFAQSVLDRLLVSAKFERLVPGSVRDSTLAKFRSRTALDQTNEIIDRTMNSLTANSRWELAANQAMLKILADEQTPLESPSIPKQGSDAPILQENDREQGNKSLSEE